MPAAPYPNTEVERLEALFTTGLLDTAPEAAFDQIARAAAALAGTPIAAVSLIDSDRQWFKARVGLDVSETPRADAFCAYTILSDEVLWVEDATGDARFVDNALVTGDFGLRHYAGAPIYGPGGHRLGALCVIDRAPRAFDAEAAERLKSLARQVSALLRDRAPDLGWTTAHVQALSFDVEAIRGLLSVAIGALAGMDRERVTRALETEIEARLGLVEAGADLLGDAVLIAQMVDFARELGLTLSSDVVRRSRLVADARAA